MNNPNATATGFIGQQQGYTCGACGAWVMPSIYAHICQTGWPAAAATSVTVPSSWDRIAAALERIAAAMERP